MFYLPREFTSVITTAFYFPPQVDIDTVLSKLHDVLSVCLNSYPYAATIVTGDFNKANLRLGNAELYQHISCPTRGENTLDHCYSQFRNGYKGNLLPAFVKSDHATIFLIPEYKQRLVRVSGEAGSETLVRLIRSCIQCRTVVRRHERLKSGILCSLTCNESHKTTVQRASGVLFPTE